MQVAVVLEVNGDGQPKQPNTKKPYHYETSNDASFGPTRIGFFCRSWLVSANVVSVSRSPSLGTLQETLDHGLTIIG